MKSFIKSLPVFLIGLVVIALMVFNRDTVSVYFAPDTYIPNVPLYLVFFAGLFLGLLMGGILLLSRKVQAQINLHRANKENIRLRAQLADLENEFDNKEDAQRAAISEETLPSSDHKLLKGN